MTTCACCHLPCSLTSPCTWARPRPHCTPFDETPSWANCRPVHSPSVSHRPSRPRPLSVCSLFKLCLYILPHGCLFSIFIEVPPRPALLSSLPSASVPTPVGSLKLHTDHTPRPLARRPLTAFRKPSPGCPTATSCWTSKPTHFLTPQISSPVFPV